MLFHLVLFSVVMLLLSRTTVLIVEEIWRVVLLELFLSNRWHFVGERVRVKGD